MSKRSFVEPRWLDCLLWQWAMRTSDVGGLGFYKTNPMLRAGIPQQAASYEPNGFNASDFEAVTIAISELPEKYRLVILRAYKPWAIATLNERLGVYCVSERTLQRWVHEAAALLLPMVERKGTRLIFSEMN